MPDREEQLRHASLLQSLTPEAMSRLGFITQRIVDHAQKQMHPSYSYAFRASQPVAPELSELVNKGLISIRPTLAEIKSMAQAEEESAGHRHIRVELTQLGMEVMSVLHGRYR